MIRGCQNRHDKENPLPQQFSSASRMQSKNRAMQSNAKSSVRGKGVRAHDACLQLSTSNEQGPFISSSYKMLCGSPSIVDTRRS